MHTPKGNKGGNRKRRRIAKVNKNKTSNSLLVIDEAVKLSSILTVSSPSSTMAVSTLTVSVSTIMMSPGVPPRLTVLVTTMDSGMIVDQVVLHHPQQQLQGPHQPAAQTLAQVHARQHQVLVLWDHLVSSLSPMRSTDWRDRYLKTRLRPRLEAI